MLEERLVYGSYPELFALAGDAQRREYLQNLSASYLYKDVLEIGGVPRPARTAAHLAGLDICSLGSGLRPLLLLPGSSPAHPPFATRSAA
jgi:predicted AAA+ superfamily ATPase